MRTLELGDLLNLERIEGALGQSWAWSPDGALLAFVVQRSKATARIFKHPRLQGMDRADVWLVDLESGESRNLTNGISDGSGWWAPEWSPGGDHLAMLSTRGGGVRLWSWERASETLDQVTRDSIRLFFGGQPFVWVDDYRILCSVLPEGVEPIQKTLENRAADRAMATWPIAWQGQEPTASVLRSGLTATLVDCDATLVIANVRDALSDVAVLVSDLSRWPIAPDIALAPDRSSVACLVPVAPDQPEAAARLRFSAPYRFRLNVTSIDRDFQVTPADLGDVIDGSLAWSPDSGHLACVAFPTGRPHRPGEARLFAVQVPSGHVTSFRTDLLDMAPDEADPELRWTADGWVIVQAASTSAMDGESGVPRRDWWLLSPDAPPDNLTASLPDAPDDLLAGSERRFFLALSDGRLWRIPLDRAPEPLEDLPPAKNIAWPPALWRPDAMTRAMAEHSRITMEGRDGEDATYAVVSVADGTSRALANPAPSAVLRDADPMHQRVLFGLDDETGSRLWLSTTEPQGTDQPRMIRESNAFLGEIAMATCRPFEYRSLNGDRLKGWLILPPDYDVETRYPTVTWVYPGDIVDERKPWLLEMAGDPSLNLHLLAAAGYAVLLPSMPVQVTDGTADPMLDLPNGVLPAVEHVVREGVADPDRLYLMGHSFGGYAVYGLISQTHRFQAAVAISGMSNLISNHGAFDARSRYEEHVDTQFFQQAWTESGQASMGSPPWADLGRFLRNSPLFAVDRVRTPLLIIHSDLDFVGIQQAEEFFSALYRLGKPAEFVRYWGESHVVESPANIKDCWRRILAWLDQHQKPPPQPDAI